MANKIPTYVDASVLIYEALKPTSATFARRLRALHVLADPDREFVASEYLRLEVLPIAHFFKRGKEILFYETFFAKVTNWIDPDVIIPNAYTLASKHGLGAIDALHVSAASSVAAEFVSAEKPTKPIYNAYTQISSIY